MAKEVCESILDEGHRDGETELDGVGVCVCVLGGLQVWIFLELTRVGTISVIQR